jgi:serine protease Do
MALATGIIMVERAVPVEAARAKAHERTAPQTAERGLADTIERAFVQIAQTLAPTVVSISTEQIEQVQRYFRGHPFMGPNQDPAEEFFRQFFGGGGGGGDNGGGPQSQEFRRFGLGSGVIIDERGYILTNEHVVADASKITVTLADGRDFDGEVKGKDPRSDLAVIKIDAKDLAVAKLGDSDHLNAGQWAIALGNPFGLVGPSSTSLVGSEPTVTVGIVSALHRRLPRLAQSPRNYSDLIQTDAAINPGNSGGPLVNIDGEVIGINVAILTSSRGFEGIGFAIPVSRAKQVLTALIEGRRVLYGWLGIQIQDLTEDVAKFYNLKTTQGVLVYQVLPDTPAHEAGLQDSDIVVRFNDTEVRNARELVELVSRTEVGSAVPVEVLRDGKRQTLQVRIGEQPTHGENGGESVDVWRGLRVAELNPEIAERFEVPPTEGGVVVVEVAPNSPADEARLEPGDIINEINRAPVRTLSDYRNAVAKVQGDALVRTTRGYVVVKAQAPTPSERQ